MQVQIVPPIVSQDRHAALVVHLNKGGWRGLANGADVPDNLNKVHTQGLENINEAGVIFAVQDTVYIDTKLWIPERIRLNQAIDIREVTISNGMRGSI